jgi:putative ABC transport system permease protein
MPLSQLQDAMLREGSVTGFNVILDSGLNDADDDDICGTISELTDENGRSLGRSAMPTKEYVSQSAHIRMAHGMAWVTSIIAVVVGAIGTLNTMIMSVVERVREISILRAIGWRKSRVVRMIVGEALLISVLGALFGAAAAAILTRWLSNQPAASGFLEGSLAPAVYGQGFVLALAVGLIGGLYPAFRAARLLPAEGLRHD